MQVQSTHRLSCKYLQYTVEKNVLLALVLIDVDNSKTDRELQLKCPVWDIDFKSNGKGFFALWPFGESAYCQSAIQKWTQTGPQQAERPWGGPFTRYFPQTCFQFRSLALWRASLLSKCTVTSVTDKKGACDHPPSIIPSPSPSPSPMFRDRMTEMFLTQ